jgi:mono/diheme cytochrome c family protein
MARTAKSSRSVVCALLALPLLCCGLAAAAAAAAAPGAAPAAAPAAAPEGPARPSRPGGPGPAATLAGNAESGAALFKIYCAFCHGPEGKGTVPNPGSTDGTIPALNPIDPSIVGATAAEFAVNVDLFLEHGSRPEGPQPENEMPAWGDTKALLPQQIADLIAYIVRLNPAPGAPAPAK